MTGLPRPTPAGSGLLVAAASLLLLRPPGALADLLLLGLGALAAVSWGLAWRAGRAAPLVRRRLPAVATRGELVHVVHAVEERRGVAQRAVWVRELAPPRGVTFFPALQAGERLEAATRVWAGQRGRLRLPGVLVQVEDPFGLFEVRVRRDLPGEVLVRPRPRRVAARLALLARPARGRDAGDGWTSVREWRPGDPRRDVSWRLSARRGCPVMVQRPPRPEQGALLVLDRALAGAREQLRFERAVALTAGIGLILLEEGRTVRFVAPGAADGLDLTLRGRPGGQRLLEALALLQPDPGGLAHLPGEVDLGEALLVSLGRPAGAAGRARLLVDEEGRVRGGAPARPGLLRPEPRLLRPSGGSA